MHSRIAKRDLDTVPRHENAVIWLMDFMTDLFILVKADQRLHASPLKLVEWGAVRYGLEGCVDEHFHYGPNFVHKEGQTPMHQDLILKVSSLVIELKLRNEGAGQRDILLSELNEIDQMIPELDKCRKRVVWR